MRRFLNKFFKNQKGQGMTEYLIIVALIAIAAIGVVTVFGRDIRALFSDTTTALTGQSVNNNSATKATVNKAKSLKNFGRYTQNGD